MFLLYADLQPEGLAALDAAPTEEAARVILSELLGLRKHAFIAYAGRMFEPFELPLAEFAAFLRAAGVLAERGGLATTCQGDCEGADS